MSEICFWDAEDSETLRHETLDGAVNAVLDGVQNFPATLVVHGYRRMKPEISYPRALEDLLEQLDEEYGNPDGGDTQPTPAMLAAEKAFYEAVLAEYKPWACEQVASVTIDVPTWIREHRPDWLDNEAMEGVSRE